MALTSEDLLNFLSEELAVDRAEINTGTLLFSSGLIDSFALVTLMTYVETEADFLISPMDVNLDNFDSIERILRYISNVKLGEDVR